MKKQLIELTEDKTDKVIDVVENSLKSFLTDFSDEHFTEPILKVQLTGIIGTFIKEFIEDSKSDEVVEKPKCKIIQMKVKQD